MSGGTACAGNGLWGRSAAAQKLEIVALDERDRIVDHSVRRAPGVGVFPLYRWKLCLVGTQNLFGDIAGATALLVNVEGVKKLNEPAFAQRRQSERLGEKADGLASQTADEARCDIEPKIDRCAANRQENHGAPDRRFVAEPDVKLARPIDDYDLPALVIGSVSDNRAQLGWVKGQRGEPARRCVEKQRARR